jgi:predicted molibdopterin-dependent oxidoreductase YjgC
MSNSILEIEEAPLLLCVGTNMTESHPVMAIRVKRALRKGARLIVIDPRRTGLADLAHRHLAIRPGSDTSVFNAMAKTIVDEGLVDREFVESRTTGFEELVEHLREYPLERAEALSGAPATEIRAAAIEYASAERAGIYYTLGVTEHVSGVGNVQSLCNLALLTGNLGKRGAGINPLRGQNNVQGAGDSGALPNVFPGMQRLDNPAVRAAFEREWGALPPPERAVTKVRAMELALEGKVRAMWIVGENTLLSDPDMKHTERALRSLEFLVVQDLFLTETARLAHVVLPAAAFCEQEGSFTNSERRVQRVRKAVEPPGEARDDCWIVGEVARRMGGPIKLQYPGGAAEIFDEMARLMPMYRGLSHARLDREGGLQWPVPSADHAGTTFLHEGRFVNGRGLLARVPYVPPDETPNAEYPFLLTTGRRLAAYHTNTQTGNSAGFEVLAPHEKAEIHPEDGRRLGVRTGDWLSIASRRGEVRARAELTDRTPEGVVFMSFSFGETPTNLLTNRKGDPVTDTPSYKVAAVRIARVDGNGNSNSNSKDWIVQRRTP